MNFEEYGAKALTTLTSDHDYGDLTPELMAQVLGLLGESGEVAEKVKKIIRDKQGQISELDKQEIVKELGDILWYINSVANLLDSDLNEVATKNLDKVLDRKKRHQIKGGGDNR